MIDFNVSNRTAPLPANLKGGIEGAEAAAADSAATDAGALSGMGLDQAPPASTAASSELSADFGGSMSAAAPAAGLDDMLGLDESDAGLSTKDGAFFDSRPEPAQEAFRHVEQDAWDVNTPNPQADAIARRELAEKSSQATEALGKLSSEDRSAYQDVAKQLDQSPRGRLALQEMLLDGTLTDPARASSKGQSVLRELQAVAKEPLAKGIERKDLMSGLVQELHVPSAINQRNRGTCAPTSVQIKMAAEHPAEYACLVGGLASRGGKVAMANGDSLDRVKGTERPDDSNRSTSSRLFQAAALDYANGRHVYDNRRDSSSGGGSGLANEEVSGLLTGLTGQKYDTQVLDMMPTLDAETSAGRSVPVGVKWGTARPDGGFDGGHELLVTKTDADRVYYDNPWGKQESMSRAEFETRLDAVSVPHREQPQAPLPEGKPGENLKVLGTNLEARIADLREAATNFPPKMPLAEQRAIELTLNHHVAVLQDVKAKLATMSLPPGASNEQTERFNDMLGKLNDQAMSVGDPMGASERDLDATLKQMRQP